MFFTRLISGVALLIAAVFAFYIGNLPLIILSALISVVGLFEFYRALGLEKKNIFGVKDVTAYNAVQRIRFGRRAAFKLA